MNNYNVNDLDFARELMLEHMTILRDESTEIITALEAGVYTGKKSLKYGGIINKIMQAFRIILDKFRDVGTRIFKKYEQDIENYESTKHEIKFTSVNLNADINYIKNTKMSASFATHPVYREINRLVRNSSRECTTPENLTLDGLINNNSVFKNYITNDSKSFGESMKTELRYGAPNKREAVRNLSGREGMKTSSELQTILDSYMIPYCKNYVSGSVSSLKKDSETLIQGITRKMENLNKQAEREATTESYIGIEQCYFKNSSISNLIVIEATGDEKQPGGRPTMDVGSDKGPQNSNQRQNENTNNNNANKNNNDNKDSTPKKSPIINEIKYLELLTGLLKSAMSAFMTVSEERFYNYIKVIRYVVGHSSVKRKAKDDVKKRDKKGVRL